MPANEQPNGRASSTTATSHPTDQRGKMLYSYQANGAGEVSVQEGDEVTIVEPDDGSGWLTVRTPASSAGLVPTSYLELLPLIHEVSGRPASAYSSSSASLSNKASSPNLLHNGMLKKKGPAVAPKRGAKKLNYIEALYDYQARSEAEWSMTMGERFVLVNKDAGDGWADVERGGVVKSVPANYITEV